MINYLHLSLDCFINYSIESLMTNYRRLAEESPSRSQFILSQSWPAPLRFFGTFCVEPSVAGTTHSGAAAVAVWALWDGIGVRVSLSPHKHSPAECHRYP